MAVLFRMQPRVHAFPQGLDIQRLCQVQGLHLHPQVVVPTLGADDLLLLFGLRGRGAVDGRKPWILKQVGGILVEQLKPP